MAYATDADLVLRVPATAALTADQRAAALLDAGAEVDDRVVGDSTVLVHCLLAAHHLQLGGLLAGGEGGVVTSRSAGEISVSYAAPAAGAVGLHGATAYGRRADAILAKYGHFALVDSTEAWDGA